MRSSVFFRICYTLFDVSPNGAFLEDTVNTYATSRSKGLPASTASELESNSKRKQQVPESIPGAVYYSEASGSKSRQYEVERQTRIQVGSPDRQHRGRRRLLRFFERKSSKFNVKGEMRCETNHSNRANPCDRDTYCTGEVSSGSLFEIQENVYYQTDLQLRENPLSNPVEPGLVASEVLWRRLRQQEQDIVNLKRELLACRDYIKGEIRKYPRPLAMGDYEDYFPATLSPRLSFSDRIHSTEYHQERDCTVRGNSSSAVDCKFMISQNSSGSPRGDLQENAAHAVSTECGPSGVPEHKVCDTDTDEKHALHVLWLASGPNRTRFAHEEAKFILESLAQAAFQRM